jgi:adenylate cyclase
MADEEQDGRGRARPHGPSSPPEPAGRLSGLVGPRVSPSLPAAAGRVFVVDDDAALGRALERTLSSLGHAVTVHTSGQAALESLAASPCDLVLLDLVMPDLDGFAVLQKIKDDPTLRSLPVVMISGLDDLDSVVRCIELGADDYLLKPAPKALLRARVDASLEKKLAQDRERRYQSRLADEARRSERLLRAIFPAQVIEELKATRTVSPRAHPDVAVLFCDVVGFTTFCDRHPLDEVVLGLQNMVQVLEDVSEQHGIEKIKTVGDAFLATAGLLSPQEGAVMRAVEAARAMIDAVASTPPYWNVRIGLHVGPVMAGVVGHRQYLFDVWGDTVNTAARIQGLGRPGEVTMSPAAFSAVSSQIEAVSLGVHEVRGKGPLELFRPI